MGQYLCNVQYVTQLGKVWGHVLPPRQRKEFIIFLECLYKLHGCEKRAHGGYHPAQLAVAGILAMFQNPPFHLLHHLQTRMCLMHAQHEFDKVILLLQVALAAQHHGIAG